MKTSNHKPRFWPKVSIVFFLPVLFATSETFAQFNKLKQKLKVPSSIQELVTSEETREFLVKELREAQSEYDTGSFNYAISLSDDAGLFENKERFERHQKLLLGALQKEEEITPAEEAMQYTEIGDMLAANGKYKAAEYNYLSALTIFVDEGLTEHTQYLKTLANLGLVYHNTGRFLLAEEFTQKVLDLRGQVLGQNTGAYASSANNLAVLRKDQGRYTEAEDLLHLALETNSRTLGENHLSTALVLNNQAILNQTVGRADQAEPMMKKALDIAGNSLNEKSGNYQKLMVNLALIYQDLGRFEEAEKTYQRAIELKERRFGKGHPDYAHMLNNLAALYLEMERLDEVEDLLIRSSSIYEDKFGRDHPSFGNSISNLGNLYRIEGKHEQAEPLLREALQIQQDNFGKDNPQTVKATEDLALLLWAQGKNQEAHLLFKQALDQSLDFVGNYFPAMSETEKAKYWEKLRPRYQRYYSFVIENHTQIPGLVGEMFDYHIATKALLLSVSTKVKARILESGDQELIRDYLVWIDQKELLAKYYEYSRERLSEENVNLDSLERATNSSEKRLSSRSQLFASGFDLKSYSFTDLKAVLKPGQGIVEIVQCQSYQNRFTDEVRYVGLILRADGGSDPEMIVLENGNQLEKRYYNYYKNSIKQKQPDEYSFSQYWEPIDRHLDGVSTVFVSVDGIYNQISLGTLRRPNGSYLIESTNIHLVGNSKDLINDGAITSVQTKEKRALMVGYPNFGSQGTIEPLPGTKSEIESLSPILSGGGYQQRILLGDEAREENVKGVDNPNLLHIATHGFFIQSLDINNEKVFGIDIQKVHQEPLLRSGLMLAGAETALSGQGDLELNAQDNGILTAFEAVTLDLDNTEIVVLSACETGLGDVKNGEGVYGLQRAFKVAGARSVIMSLWKVSDQATKDLMTDFYRQWVKTGDKARAFKQAQLNLMKRYPEPYYWGAFVLIGV